MSQSNPQTNPFAGIRQMVEAINGPKSKSTKAGEILGVIFALCLIIVFIMLTVKLGMVLFT